MDHTLFLVAFSCLFRLKCVMAKKLTPKQDLFCREYLKDLNASQAAIRAGYSKKTSPKIGFENLQKPEIKKKIDKLKEKRAKKADFGAQEVLAELKKLATSNLGDFFDESGYLKSWGDLTRDQTACLESVDFKHFSKKGDDRLNISQAHKLKFWSKLKALELYGSHLSLFKNEVADPYEGQEPNEE